MVARRNVGSLARARALRLGGAELDEPEEPVVRAISALGLPDMRAVDKLSAEALVLLDRHWHEMLAAVSRTAALRLPRDRA
jgi:hypothetical protein